MNYSRMSKQVIDIGHKALEAPDINQFKSEILCDLENAFRAESSVFLDWDHLGEKADAWSKSDMYFPRWESKYRDLYWGRLRFEDPLFDWLESGHYYRTRGVTTLSNLINFRDVKKSLLFDSLLKPLDCRYIVTMALHCGGNLVANVSLLRSTGSRDFNDTEVHCAELVAPMLAGAYKKLLLGEQRDHYQGVLGAVSDSLLEDPVLLLSQSLTPVYASEKFRQRMLELEIRDPNVLLQSLNRSGNFQQLCKLLESPSPASVKHLPSRLSEAVEISPKLALEMEIRVLSNAFGEFFVGIIPGAVIGSGQPVKPALTLREQQIAQLLAAGLSTQVAGDQLCISQWTVKNHLKQIYAKLGIKSRAELARHVS